MTIANTKLYLTAQGIPHHSQRYSTVGDYVDHPDGSRSITVSEMDNIDYMFLVAMHEAIEQHLCLKRGIAEVIISDFDVKFENNRSEGNTDEPGFAEGCPYAREHAFATRIEKLVAEELGCDWTVYERAINELDNPLLSKRWTETV